MKTASWKLKIRSRKVSNAAKQLAHMQMVQGSNPGAGKTV
jgi:hypothetical protein